jgi:DnaJ-class molecular chaperone
MASKCSKCSGRRLINENKQVELDIEQGMAGGDTIMMEREGE